MIVSASGEATSVVGIADTPVDAKLNVASGQVSLTVKPNEEWSITASGGTAYFLLFGRFLTPFFTKTGVNWVSLAEMSGHILCNWQQGDGDARQINAVQPPACVRASSGESQLG